MDAHYVDDGGTRISYGTGATREPDDDKPRPDLISPFFKERLGRWLSLGAKKYALWNWARGMPFSRCLAAMERHLMRYQQGSREEDHLAAVAFAAMQLIHYEEMIARKALAADLNDLPCFVPVFRLPQDAAGGSTTVVENSGG